MSSAPPARPVLGAWFDPARAAADTVAWRAGQPVTRAALRARVNDWRALALGLAGPQVVVYAEDSVEFAAALLGAWAAGKTVVLPGDTLPQTLAGLDALSDPPPARLGELPGGLRPAAAGVDATPQPALSPDATRLLVFTSGSSGLPLAIPKRLAQLDAELCTLEAGFGAALPASARVWATVSHQHIYGLLFRVLWPLAAGRAFVAERLVYPEAIVRALAEAGAPALLVSSPAHLGRLPPALDAGAARPWLAAVFSSGAPLPPEAAGATLDQLGQSPVEVYGSSETGGIAWRQRARHGDTWTALDGVQWQLRDGCLAVRSPHLADDDWFQTADRAERAGDYGFQLRGRVDRIAKIEGKRISLSAMELCLRAQPQVADARVLVLDTSEGGRPAAVVALDAAGLARLQAEGKAALVQGLRAALATLVEPVALPRRWRLVQSLPLDAQSKTSERALAALFRPERPLLQWLQRDALAARGEFVADPALRAFDGHFPENPILPGVAQLDWAIGWAREAFVLPPVFLRLETLKFQQPILPQMRVTLALAFNAGAGTLQFEYHSDAGRHASGRIVFGPGPDAAGEASA